MSMTQPPRLGFRTFCTLLVLIGGPCFLPTFLSIQFQLHCIYYLSLVLSLPAI